MYKKTIEYPNPFTGENEELVAYFNLSQLEVVKLNPRGIKALEAEYRAAQDLQSLEAFIDKIGELVLSAYGSRVDDKFIKNEQVRSDFVSSGAFEAYLIELMSNPEEQVRFFVGVIPNHEKDRRKEVEARLREVITDSESR